MGTIVNLVHVGLGLIGGRTIDLLREQRARWEQEFGVSLAFRSFIDSSGGVACDEAGGYADQTIDRLLELRAPGTKVLDAAPSIGHSPRTAAEAVDIALSMGKVILIDCATGSQTAPLSATAVGNGSGAVFSNKAPLSLPLQDRFASMIWSNSHHDGLVRYETSCGAGLPVISTLRALLDSGDEVITISGALSGTLGAIFADVANGASFSQAVRSAKDRGYTEPDPRDDLSGLDVARKALILARTMGLHLDLEDISVESLVPEKLNDVSIPEFLDQIESVDSEMAERAAGAKSAGSSLKYVASVSAPDGVSVGVRSISRESVLGSLQGPANIITFRTRRYDDFPLTVSGPGAGALVTAAGVVADVLSLAKDMRER